MLRIIYVLAMFVSLNLFAIENSNSFREKLLDLASKNPPQWMVTQIENDLARYRDIGITKESLDKLMDVTKGDLAEMTARFQIINNHVHVTVNEEYLTKFPAHRDYFYTRLAIDVYAIEKLANNIKLPDVDFILTVNDGAYIRDDFSLAPIFTFAKNKHIDTHILMPDQIALSNYEDLGTRIPNASNNIPWRMKYPKAFWRGTNTDGLYDAQRWKLYPRAKLVLLSLQNPNLIDAKFALLVGEAQKNVEMLSMPEIKGDFVLPENSLWCKYLIELDGCTCSSQRIYWTLLSNCAVFKQETDNIQWFYGALKRDVHFVPIAKDMSDLVEKILWAQKNDAIVQIIAKNGTKFAKENLREEMIYYYLYLLLVRYAELQKF